ncbi:centrosomal protein of 70 kDa isoform X3 [Cyclopterus lumpus]|uniref:Sosondowah ankyrin repeat domain family Cb n=1 Tax=Cyclopterus lumpus TaxID=8103 RepID=A0A8C2X446_CYCLU|nr:centrosomal protein of 70 kDa isoform X3 [Cyclopterus lumpus]
MASECTREALLGFLTASGGKVKHADLIEHFKVSFPEAPEQRAAVRREFKHYVDNVAFVKTESEMKYVCLRKKFRVPEKEQLNGRVSDGTRAVHQEGLHHRDPAGSRSCDAAELRARPRAAPGSGYGSDGQVRVPHAAISAEQTDGLEMGNRGSFKREKRESKKERVGHRVEIPDIAVMTASPLPAEGSMFNLPGPVQTGSTGQVDAGGVGLHPRDRPVESLSPEGPNELEHINVAFRNSKGSRRGVLSRPPESDEDGGQSDTRSLSGSEGLGSPKSSRKHFIQAMMSSSPQLRRSMAVRSSVYLTSGNDGDSASLASSNPDDDRTSVALDPLEHEWMMCSSDGEWGNLYPLLATDPSLVLRKDFVTGFTCLHWAAKQGKPELMALLINFAKQHDVPVDVDVRSNTGYTPLHVAAMHNRMEVVKLLVGAYSADVEVRDYSGRKACQYLTDNVSVDIRDIIGAYERSDSKNADRGGGGRWRFSKALQSNLKPLRLLNPNDCDAVDGEARPRAKVLRRKSSLSRMKPKLQRLRLRTSQIVHSTTFRESEEGSGSGSFKSRPKTHFFG